ncbi:hypothetical protein PYK79_13295 [Streptomyces sp. ID05-04B]|uniref:hypothetical protein n=1 Tax=Streptomyces sp. ID05-04B TaxID=3028661 RepID=UPI0029C289EA|nr:hypothetical protein [Streptomyces sp. ID05-04B]MDX5564121.1 hypothetical protein [Streptomyces sp. ID05-04B]
MAYAAGDRLTAGRTNRLRTKTDGAIGSSTVAASQTNVDVPSATVTMTAETAADYKVICIWDFVATGAPATSSTGRLQIDGVSQSPLGVFNASGAGDRDTVTQVYEGTLSASGSHTFKLIATTSTNTTVQGANSSITVDLKEIV